MNACCDHEASQYSYEEAIDDKQFRIAQAEQWMGACDSPDVIAYNVMMKVSLSVGEFDRAEMWLRRMLDNRVAPNDVTYTQLAEACRNAERHREARRWEEKAAQITWNT